MEEEYGVFKLFGWIALCLVLLYAIGFVLTGGDLFIYQFWAPKRANAENQVFHHTQAYVDGKNTYIARLCAEVPTTEGPQRTAVQNEILQEAATVAASGLNEYVKGCVASARSTR